MIVVRDKHKIDVSGRLVIFIFEANFGEGCPLCSRWKEEVRSVVGDDPVLPKSYRAGNCDEVAFRDAARSKRIIGSVLRAVGNLIVEWTEFLGSMPLCLFGEIVDREPEYLDKRMRFMGHF